MPDLIQLDGTAPRDEVAALLRQLTGGVDAGTVTLAVDGDEHEIDLPPELAYEVDLESMANPDGVAMELEVELNWVAGEGRGVAVPAVHSEAEVRDEDIEGDADHDGSVGVSPESAESDHAVDFAASDETTAGDESDGGVEREAGGAAEFELFTDRAGEWRWRLVHDNGNVIANSGEGYTRKANARKGLESVRSNAPAADVVELSGGE